MRGRRSMMSRGPATATPTEHPETHVLRFGPVILAYILIPVLPAWGHHYWGQELPMAAIAPIVMFIGMVGVGAVAVVSAVNAQPNDRRMRVALLIHTLITVLLVAVTVIFMQIGGWWGHKYLHMIYVTLGLCWAMSWCVRRFDVFRRDKPDMHGKHGSVEDVLGLSIKSAQTLPSANGQATSLLKLGMGQTAADVAKKKDNIASMIGAPVGSVRVIEPAGAGADTAQITVVHKSPFAGGDLNWHEPTHPGGSVEDGVKIAIRETGEEVWIYPFGDRDGKVVPGHVGQGGMPRSGKGTCAEIEVVEFGTRVDVWMPLADCRKADQFYGDLQDAIGWFVQSPNGVRAQILAYKRAMQARNRAMSEFGYKKWSRKVYEDPRLKMPAIYMLFEEMSDYAGDLAEEMIALLEGSLSAGMVAHCSQQRWTHDRVPTSLRSNIGNAICFGMQDVRDSEDLLTDMTLKYGPNPGTWKTKFPGRCLVEGNGIPEEQFPIAAQGLIAPSDALRKTLADYAPIRAKLDPVTRKAFGEAYEAYEKSRGGVLVSAPATPAEDPPLLEIDEDDTEEHVMPAQPEPELANSLDPRMPLNGELPEDIDFTPPDDGRPVLSPEEKRAAWRELMADLLTEARHAENYEYSVDVFRDRWDDKVGTNNTMKKWLLYQFIDNDIKEGLLARTEKSGGYILLESELASSR